MGDLPSRVAIHGDVRNTAGESEQTHAVPIGKM
jgi:hypothetical protein